MYQWYVAAISSGEWNIPTPINYRVIHIQSGPKVGIPVACTYDGALSFVSSVNHGWKSERGAPKVDPEDLLEVRKYRDRA